MRRMPKDRLFLPPFLLPQWDSKPIRVTPRVFGRSAEPERRRATRVSPTGKYSAMWFLVLTLCMSPALGVPVAAEGAAADRTLPAWRDGVLEIHFINTGKGDAALFILPDGTTLLRDAGDTRRDRPAHYDAPQLPDASRRAGQWIARYIRAVHPRAEEGKLDYALVSHFHGDHMGTVTADSPESVSGAYRLTGITDVAESVPIRHLLDRGWPEYDFPQPLTGVMMDNYRAFIRWRVERSDMRIERFEAGRNDQVVLQHAPEKYPGFEIRNIAANGYVWTGIGRQVRNRFPHDDPPSENNCSLAFRLRYGDFTYFDGGDMVGLPPAASPVWRDMESALAWVVGPVDAHALNHHGSADAVNAFFLSVLRPRVHLVSVYAASQPGPDVMRRLLSERIYPGPRDVFLTNGVWEGRRPNMVTLFGEEETSWLIDRIEGAAASRGHMVVRVDPGGETYRVFVLEDGDETRTLLSVHGPYRARGWRESTDHTRPGEMTPQDSSN
jgi:beta-lactamase superfamily II metal-dependent hydrolase